MHPGSGSARPCSAVRRNSAPIEVLPVFAERGSAVPAVERAADDKSAVDHAVDEISPERIDTQRDYEPS